MITYFSINGVALPSPDRGLQIKRTQQLDQGTNALGQIVAQKINRRLTNIDTITWSYLTADQWTTILNEINKSEGTLTFYDALTNTTISRQVLWGDTSEEPLFLDAQGGVTVFTNCTAALKDIGL
nr:MAG TPA: hypothetical protein [Caudoviricetes sp.]